ncbi:MAG: hypothetical protein AAF617_04320 [Bacteroidota bacterium]
MIKRLLCVLFLLPMCLQAQKELSGTFPVSDEYKWFIIYKLDATRQKYIGNGKMQEGKIQYTFPAASEKGMYRLVYSLPQEEKNFDFIYNGEEDIAFAFDGEALTFTASK